MNKYRPHVLVLPEDDANRQIANGFLLAPALRSQHVQLLRPAGGWTAARDKMLALLPEMSKYPGRTMVLLVDFDGQPGRAEQILANVPAALRERIFVLGVFSEPERLRTALGSYEKIGRALGDECAAAEANVWAHDLLAHNAGEAARLMARVRAVLF